jgi:hypothetical protein
VTKLAIEAADDDDSIVCFRKATIAMPHIEWQIEKSIVSLVSFMGMDGRMHHIIYILSRMSPKYYVPRAF